MTKNQIALDKNFITNRISRQIQVDEKLEYQVGDIITLDDATSWTDGGEFKVETPGEFTYVFWINNDVNVHQVDYENEEECEILGCEDCYEEKEVLLEANVQLRIVNIIKSDDEVPFTTIETEII